MSEELVITEKRGYTQILTLNRPDDMNAFNTALATALGEALEAMDNDEEVRVGVLTGAGRGFSAGMDLGHWERLSSCTTVQSHLYFVSRERRKSLQSTRSKFCLIKSSAICTALSAAPFHN